jgi:hypothetical protein
MDNKEKISVKYYGYMAGKLGIGSKKIVIKKFTNNSDVNYPCDRKLSVSKYLNIIFFSKF